MQTMTLTAKGQFTLNKGLMEHLGVKAGEQVSIRKLPDGKIEIEAHKNKTDTDTLFNNLDNIFCKPDRKISIEEIETAIAEGYVKA